MCSLLLLSYYSFWEFNLEKYWLFWAGRNTLLGGNWWRFEQRETKKKCLTWLSRTRTNNFTKARSSTTMTCEPTVIAAGGNKTPQLQLTVNSVMNAPDSHQPSRRHWQLPLTPGARPPDPPAASRFPAGETQPASIKGEKMEKKNPPEKRFAASLWNLCFPTFLILNCYATASNCPLKLLYRKDGELKDLDNQRGSLVLADDCVSH